MSDKENVLNFKKDGIILPLELKTKLESKTSPEAVTKLEEEICIYIVKKVVEFATKLGESLGSKVADNVKRMNDEQ